MTKLIKKCYIILLIIIVALSISGCHKIQPQPLPAPEPTTVPPPTTVPTPTLPAEPSPSPEPGPSTKFIGRLAIGEAYCLGGDSNIPSILFYDDGLFRSENFIGEFKVVNDIVEIYVDDTKIDEMKIIDEYTLESKTDEALFIREGGAGYVYNFSAENDEGIRRLFFNEYYFLSGDENKFAYRFHENGDIDIGTPDHHHTGKYTYNGEVLEVKLDGEVVMIFGISNAAELGNVQTQEMYTLKGAQEKKLKKGSRYYYTGHEDSDYLIFNSDGSFSMEGNDGSSWSGTYTVDSDTISAELDGDVAHFRILNSYILKMESEEFIFIRIP